MRARARAPDAPMRLASFAVLLTACSSGATTDVTPTVPDASAAHPGEDSGAPTDASRVDDARAPPTDAAIPDGGPRSDAAADAGPVLPNPPPGSAKCGAGTFSAADVTAACNAPGGLMAYLRACDELSTQGGAYEVWCSPSGVYLWARLDAVKARAPASCTVTFDGSVYTLEPPMYVDVSEFDVSGGVRRESGTARPSGDTFIDPSAPPSTIALEATASVTAANGTATMWLVTRQSACPGIPDGPPVIRGGVPIKWP
jgi:hypothetical protein